MRRCWLSIVALTVVGACSSDDAAPAATERSAPETTAAAADLVPPSWEPATRAEELAWEASSSPEGGTLQHAIDSFGLLVPDFPGVTPSDLPPGEITSGTSMLTSILSVRDQLSDEQLAALEDYLADGRIVGRVSADGTMEDVAEPPGTSQPAGWRRQGNPGVADYLAALAEMRQAWLAHLPDAPGHTYELWVTDQATSWMDARAPEEKPDVCLIRVHPAVLAIGPAPDHIRWMIAHELFHCMQFRWAATAPFWNPHQWVVEGGAEWAVADLFRAKPTTANYLEDDWFAAPHRPLGSRAYDAWPLYESAWRNGDDVIGSLIRMMREPVPTVPAMLGYGALDGLISRIDWGTRAVRDQVYGDDWWLAWPSPGRAGFGPTKTTALAGPFPTGVRTIHGTARFGHQTWMVEWGNDVDLVSVFPKGSPFTTFTAHGTQVVADGTPGRFCFRPDGCVCPDGGGSDIVPMVDRMMLASFAPVEVAPSAIVFAEPWDPETECDPDAPDQGSSNGDPHLVSFDGLPFDIVTLGEFVLARDGAGDFEVQTRHAPFASGTGTTAVAVGDGSTRVTFTMPEFFSTDPPTVRVDGAVVTDGELIAGDLRVTWDDASAAVLWPDGSRVALDWYLGWFVTITVPPERSARMEGLIGAADGDLRNDLRLPDGTFADTDDVSADESPYSLSWVVDESTTLFDYEPGESVATFRSPHPDPRPPVIDTAAIESCSTALGADVTGHDVASCAFDVTVTGEDAFVDAYVTVADDRRDPPELAEPLMVLPTTEPPEAVADAVSGAAGEPVLTLSADQPSGTVDAVAGAVLLARADSCDEAHVAIEVTTVGGDGFATGSLCDSQDLGGIGLDDVDEWIEGEAYLWLSGDGEYNVTLAALNQGALGEVEVYLDPTPTVVDGAALADGDRSSLAGLADTVVYLPDPESTLDATGLDTACAVEVWRGSGFPDPEPFDLGACEHDDSISFPPTDMVIPVVVFNRTDDVVPIALTPGG